MAAKKVKICQACSITFKGRKDAKTCSPGCRKRLQRNLQALATQKAARLESALGQEFHRIAASLLRDHVVRMPFVLADERGSVPVPVLEPPAAAAAASAPTASNPASIAPLSDSLESGDLASEPVSLPAVRPSRFSVFSYNKFAFSVTGIAVVLIAIVSAVGFILLSHQHSRQTPTAAQKAGSYAIGNLPLGDIPGNSQLELGQVSTVSINGQLRVSNTLVLLPSGTPSNPETGQFYYDKTTNVPYFYNGTQFVSLAPQRVSSIGGTSGAVGLDNSLSIFNNQLGVSSSILQQIANASAAGSGVTSLQGQTGNVTLGSGPGISINGTTISNSGVLSLTGTADQVNVSGGTGNVTLSLPQSIAVTSTPTFGGLTVNGTISTATLQQAVPGNNLNISAGNDNISFTAGGRTFVFPTSGPASQIICTTGVTCASGGGQAVLLQPGAVQADPGSGPSVFINNTGGGILAELQSGGVDRFVVSNGGNVTAGTYNGQTISSAANFTGTVSIQGSSALTLGTASTNTGAIIFKGAGGVGTLTLQGPTTPNAGNFVLSLPTITGNDTVCTVNLGNCAGSGDGITGSGTSGTIPVFTGTGSIGNSTLTQSGSALTASGTLTVQGANALTLGTASTNTGAIQFKNSSNANTLTLQAGATGSNFTLTLPTTTGANGDCLQSNGSGALSFASCTGGAGGGVTSLDGLTGVLTLNNSSGSGSAVTIDNAKADASTKGIATFNATNFSDNGSGTINTIQNISTSSSPVFVSPNATTGVNTGAGAGTQRIDASGNLVNIGTITSGLINGQTISSSANFTGTVAIQGANALTLGTASTNTGAIVFQGSGGAGTLKLQGPTTPNVGNFTLTIPTITANDTICVATLANCAASGAAGGDLAGSYPNPTIAKLQGTTLTLSSLASGDVLQYNGSAIVNGHITNSNLTAGTFSNITGVGALTSGSIASGFGTISTGNNIITTATVQGGTVNATTALQLGGADINTAGTLSNVAYLNASNTFTGTTNTFNATGGTSLAVTGAPTNSATASLIRIGNAIAGGNASANGGTYIGLNEPASGAGSVADFLNFQNNGTSKLKVTSAGAVTSSSSVTASTFSSTGTSATAAFAAVKPSANAVLQNFLLAGDANPSLQINGDGTINFGAGGASATDTNLYRSAAGVLQTDSTFSVESKIFATGRISSELDTDVDTRVALDQAAGGAGKAGIIFGPGTSSADTNLYRSAAGVLKTDGTLNAVTAYQLNGTQIVDGSRNLTNIGTITSGLVNGQTISSSANFTGTLAVAGSTLSVGTPGTTVGSINLSTSAANTRQVVLQGLNPTGSGNATIQFPSIAGGSTDTVCLQTAANCAASGAAGGDLAGSYPNPTIAKLQGTTLTLGSLASGDVLQYNGSAIVNGHITNSNLTAGTFSSITGTGALTSGSIASGFGTISTGNNITTTATVQGGTVSATSSSATALQVLDGSGGSVFTVDSSNAAAKAVLGGTNKGDSILQFQRSGSSKYGIGSDSNSLGGSDSLFFYNYTGNAYVAAFRNNGAAMFSNSTNSATGFQVQNAGGTGIFTVDTSANRVAIAQATASYTLDVAGDINTTGVFRVGGVGGATTTCTGGQVLQNQAVTGGITTGGSCGSASGVTTIGTIDTQTKSANGAVISGNSIYLQTADASNPGLVSTGTQTLAGAKTFSSLLTGSAGAAISGATTSINDSSNNITNINTGSSTGAVNIGNGAAGTITIQGAGAASLTGATSAALQTGASGTVNVGTTVQTSALNLGNTSASSTTLINGGTGGTAISLQAGTSGTILLGTTNVNTVTVGSAANTGTLTFGQSTVGETINIGNGTVGAGHTNNINIGTSGTSTGKDVLTIGSLNDSSTTTIQGGGSSSAVSIQSAASGTISLGSSGVANTLQFGNTTGAVAQTINIGNNATASSTNTINIGSTIGTSPVTLQAGSSGVLVKSSSANALQVQDTSGNIVLHVDASDPNYATLNLGGTGKSFSELDFFRGSTQTWQLGTDDTGPASSAILYLYNHAQTGIVMQFDNTTSAATFQNTTDSVSGFKVVTDAGSNVFNVDTTNSKIGTVNTTTASTNSNAVILQSGNATGTTSNSGNVTLDSGTATGTAGSVNVGTGAYAHNINIGNTSGTSAIALNAGSAGATLQTTSTTAFVIQSTTPTNLFTADTSGMVITISGTANSYASLTLTDAHIKFTQTTAPTAVKTAALGSTGSCSIAGTDSGGEITMVASGTGLSNLAWCTITFHAAYGVTPRIIFTAANGPAGNSDPYVLNQGTTSFQIGNTNNAIAGTMLYDYIVFSN